MIAVGFSRELSPAANPFTEEAMNKKEYNARYYEEHEKEVKKQQAGYREKHRKHLRAYFITFYQENKERRKKVAAQYQKDHPDKCKTYHANRRTKKSKAGGAYTSVEWNDLCSHYDHKCLDCRKRRKLEADHIIPVSKGGTSNIDNIQPLCRTCNAHKGTKTTDFRRPHGKR